MTENEIKLNLARHRIAAAALQWVGTPFFPHMGKRGIGADCVWFALGVYQDAGIIPPGIVLPKYSLDGGSHRRSSLVLDYMHTCPWLIREESPALGSIITFQFGRVPHHVGIMVDEVRFLHSVRSYGVIEGSLEDSTFKDKLTSSWRPKV